VSGIKGSMNIRLHQFHPASVTGIGRIGVSGDESNEVITSNAGSPVMHVGREYLNINWLMIG
jgi:hypothetical protein